MHELLPGTSWISVPAVVRLCQSQQSKLGSQSWYPWMQTPCWAVRHMKLQIQTLLITYFSWRPSLFCSQQDPDVGFIDRCLVPSSGWNPPDKICSGRPKTVIRMYHLEVVRRQNHASVLRVISAMAYEGLAALISQQQSQWTRRPQFTSFGTVAAFLQEYENAPPTAAVPSSSPVMQVPLRNNWQKTAIFSGPSTHGGWRSSACSLREGLLGVTNLCSAGHDYAHTRERHR